MPDDPRKHAELGSGGGGTGGTGFCTFGTLGAALELNLEVANDVGGRGELFSGSCRLGEALNKSDMIRVDWDSVGWGERSENQLII